MPLRTLWVAATLVALGSTGCASTLSTLQTATPTKRKQVQVTGGAGVYANLGPVVTVIDQGIKQGNALNDANKTGQPYELSEEDQQELLTAGIALAIMHPWQGYEINVRTGILEEDMDVGFRYSMNAVRLDTKYRFLHTGDDPEEVPELYKRKSFDLAIGLGISKYIFSNPVLDALSYVQLDDFSRWDFEVPIYYTVDFGDMFKLYGAAKYVYSYTTLDASLVNYTQQATNITGLDVSIPAKVHTHFVGTTAGFMAGYRWVHVMAELTAGWTFSDPVIFGRKRKLGGPTIYPALGIGLKFP